jgi:two-component system sensor histidine kinase CiaH
MRVVQSATFKLTLWYLGIIMVLSGLFSFALYSVSYDQLSSNAVRQRDAIQRLPLPASLEPNRSAFTLALDNQLAEDQRYLLLQLLVLNLATLLVGGAASYLLSVKTLRPIEDAMEAQGRFTADASHELRTPLTAMRSEIEVALREKLLTSVEARNLLESNLEEIAKLENLSGGLLRLARFENSLDAREVARVKVRELFEEAIDRHQTRLSDRHIELEVVADSEAVTGDRASLVELIAILLDNAIKYSPEKSKVVLASHKNGQFVRLSVADQGVGIKASDIPFIFHRFYRADRSRSKELVDGYGLGLSIAKRIVDLHHGDISVDSVPGNGSTFRVKLPANYQFKNAVI